MLVTNQIVGHSKLHQLAQLGKHATIGALVDAPEHVESLDLAAQGV